MPSPSVLFGSIITIASVALLITLFIFAITRKLYRSLPAFFIYLLLLVPRELIWLWVSHTSVYYTQSAFYFYWITDVILSFLRLMTIIEICRRTLRNYPAVWAFAWRILATMGILLSAWAGHSAMQNSRYIKYFIISGMQRFEFMQAILLLIVLTIGIYYRIHISPLHRWVLTGICTYSAVLVTNYELGRNTGIVANSIYDFVQRLSFTATEVIWTWAVWRWAALPARPAKLIPQEVYEEHSAGIHDRLRDLNDRLRVIFR